MVRGNKYIVLQITKDFSMRVLRSKNQQIMILRNPARMRDSFFVLVIGMLVLFAPIMVSGQGVFGTVKDPNGQQPLAQTSITLFVDSVRIHTVTDNRGYFEIRTPLAGKGNVVFQLPGFQTYQAFDIPLDGYTRHRLDIRMDSLVIHLNDVQVTFQKRPDMIVKSITPHKMLSVAGNFEDPVRIAHSEPGIVLLNDQSNQFSLRGQSPLLNTWHLEGLEIVNPSHTSNAGTPTDRPTPSGGGINLFSAQILGETNIYTGLNPIRLGRNAGAVIDMHLHESTRSELRARAGLIGLELGGAKSFSENSTIDFNFRYSFTGLLTGLGADFGGEKISFYDGVISYVQRGQQSKLKIFAWAGSSENDFEALGDSVEHEKFKDFFDIRYANTVWGAGLRHDLSFARQFAIRTGASYSELDQSYMRQGSFRSQDIAISEEATTKLGSFFTEIRWLASPLWNTAAGVAFTYREYTDPLPLLPLWNETRIRPYAELNMRLLPKVVLEAGAEASINLSTNALDPVDVVPGFRALIRTDVLSTLSIFAGIRHGIGQSILPVGQLDNQVIATTLEGGLSLTGKKQTLAVKGYLQVLDRITVYRLLPFGVQYLTDIFEPGLNTLAFIDNNGTAKGYGMEAEWQMRGHSGWQLTLNQSVYQSLRKTPGFAYRDGRFNGIYGTHATFSKEWVRKKGERQRTWNMSVRGMLNGGIREEEIDVEASDAALATVPLVSGNYSIQLPAFTRVDASLVRTTAFEKSRWRWSLDIQNLFGLTNIAYHYYDPFLGKVTTQDHLGLIPVLSLQISW